MLNILTLPSSLPITLITKTNNLRRQHKLHPLKLNTELESVAQSQALFMCETDELSHLNAENEQLSDRLKAFSVDSDNINIGENIARQQVEDIDSVFNVWTASETHLQNLIGDYDFTGVGSCKSKTGLIYWVQVFSSGDNEQSNRYHDSVNDKKKHVQDYNKHKSKNREENAIESFSSSESYKKKDRKPNVPLFSIKTLNDNKADIDRANVTKNKPKHRIEITDPVTQVGLTLHKTKKKTPGREDQTKSSDMESINNKNRLLRIDIGAPYNKQEFIELMQHLVKDTVNQIVNEKPKKFGTDQKGVDDADNELSVKLQPQRESSPMNTTERTIDNLEDQNINPKIFLSPTDRDTVANSNEKVGETINNQKLSTDSQKDLKSASEKHVLDMSIKEFQEVIKNVIKDPENKTIEANEQLKWPVSSNILYPALNNVPNIISSKNNTDESAVRKNPQLKTQITTPYKPYLQPKPVVPTSIPIEITDNKQYSHKEDELINETNQQTPLDSDPDILSKYIQKYTSQERSPIDRNENILLSEFLQTIAFEREKSNRLSEINSDKSDLKNLLSENFKNYLNSNYSNRFTKKGRERHNHKNTQKKYDKQNIINDAEGSIKKYDNNATIKKNIGKNDVVKKNNMKKRNRNRTNTDKEDNISGDTNESESSSNSDDSDRNEYSKNENNIENKNRRQLVDFFKNLNTDKGQNENNDTHRFNRSKEKSKKLNESSRNTHSNRKTKQRNNNQSHTPWSVLKKKKDVSPSGEYLDQENESNSLETNENIEDSRKTYDVTDKTSEIERIFSDFLKKRYKL